MFWSFLTFLSFSSLSVCLYSFALLCENRKWSESPLFSSKIKFLAIFRKPFLNLNCSTHPTITNSSAGILRFRAHFLINPLCVFLWLVLVFSLWHQNAIMLPSKYEKNFFFCYKEIEEKSYLPIFWKWWLNPVLKGE